VSTEEESSSSSREIEQLQLETSEDHDKLILGENEMRPESVYWTLGSLRIPKLQVKATFFLILIISAAIVLGLAHEIDTRTTHQFSVARAHPVYLYLIIGQKDLEITMNVPPLTDLTHYEREKTCIIGAENSTNSGCDPDLPPISSISVTCFIERTLSNGTNWISFGNSTVTLDTTESKTLLYFFDFERDINYTETRAIIATNHTKPVPVMFDSHPTPTIARYRVLLAGFILVLLYTLIISELVHQTIAASLCAFLGISCLSLVHDRPPTEVVIGWIDYGTIGLLFGMMVIVGIFSRTGFFEWSAVKAYKLSGGNLWYLTILLSMFTCITSSFLDNVTTILLIVPVTCKLCKVLDVEPRIMILCQILFSNIGGTATIIGDPPNVIIANNPHIGKAISFGNFTLHVTIGIIFCILITWVYIWKFYSSSLHRDPVMRVKAEALVWQKTLARLDENDASQSEVRQHMLGYLSNLEEKIAELQNASNQLATIQELEEIYVISDWPLFVASCAVILVVILMFFIHPVLGLELSLAWIAMIGAVLHTLVVMIIRGNANIKEILEKVEWETLLFFASLFILMGAITKLGFIDYIGEGLKAVVGKVPEGKLRLFVAVLLITWISAFASALIDNIPYTVTLTPVVVDMATSELNLPLTPLVWALVYGTCLGGNGTLTGASANIVGVALAEQNGTKISFMEFTKFGFPAMVLTVFAATLWLVIFHVLIPWHE